MTKRSAACAGGSFAAPRRPHQHLVAAAGRLGAADLLGQPLRLDRLRHADDHDQSEVSAQYRLAARVDIPAQRFDRIAHRRDDARMVVGHDGENEAVLEAGDHRGDASRGGKGPIVTHAWKCD